MDSSFMLVSVILAVISIFVYYWTDHSYRLNKSYLRHSTIFLFGFFVVAFQCDIDYIIGFIDETSDVWIDTRIVCKAMSLSNIALNSFLFGINLFSKNYNPQFLLYKPKYEYFFPDKRILYYIGYAMIVYYLATVDKRFLMGGYARGVDQGSINFIMVLFEALLIAIWSISCYELNKKKFDSKKKLSNLTHPIILTVIFLILIVLTGRRAPAIKISCLIMVVYICIKGNRANYKKIGLVAVIALMSFSILGVIRQLEQNDARAGMNILMEKMTILPFTSEFANSAQTLHVAVANVPKNDEFNYGLTFFPGFAVLVPGLDRIIHAIVPPTIFISSPEYISWTYFGEDPIWGLGSSSVTDVYISFGPIGVIIVFILFGFYVRYLEVGTFSLKRSPYFLVLSFCCYSQLLALTRGPFSMLFLSWSYASLIILFFSRKRQLQYD